MSTTMPVALTARNGAFGYRSCSSRSAASIASASSRPLPEPGEEGLEPVSEPEPVLAEGEKFMRSELSGLAAPVPIRGIAPARGKYRHSPAQPEAPRASRRGDES